MRRFFYLCILMLFAQSGANAQHHHYSIAISDSAAVPAFTAGISGGSPTLLFGVPYLDSLAATGTIYSFGQGYPGANSSFLRDIYFLETDDSTLPYLLRQWDSIKYYYVQEDLGYVPLAGTYPSDYPLGAMVPMGCDTPRHLELIGAPFAWDYTKGDTSVIIGVSDIGFDTSHPDMKDIYGSKYHKMIDFVPNASRIDHGLEVAGLIAGGTNNNLGLPAIGWNCRLEALDNSLYYGLNDIFRLSKDSLPIINASYSIHYRTDTARLRDELLANEVYERGVSLVASAGDGMDVGHHDPPSDYQYPASFNNVISVTSIGCATEPGGGYPVAGPYYGRAYSVKYQHIFDRTGTGTANLYADTLYRTNAHNDRVDICAPGYAIPTLRSDRSGNPYVSCGNDSFDRGSSYAAPLVAGTLGLIHSVNRRFSPYQREVILKKTAKFIDTIGDNHYFAGRLGAGALQADLAVQFANPQSQIHLEPNDSATQTMYIEGLEYDHLCFDPANGISPKFKVKVVNGNGHYRYEWQYLPANQISLNDTTSATPSIVIGGRAGSSGPRFRYLLRVFDSSEIPKVALREFDFTLRDTSKGADLAMRDSYFDMLDEPNLQATVNPNNWHIWESPDLWNRQTADGVREHEDGEYFRRSTDSNYLYVRVRNVGCRASATDNAFLHLYWTLAATGERWPGAWDTATYCSVSGGRVMAGAEITNVGGIMIPPLNPGDSFIIAKSWRPTNPDSFCNALNHRVDMCVLARIQEGTRAPFGIKSEGSNLSANVRNSNNVVTRNLEFVSLGRYQARYASSSSHLFFVSSSHDAPVTVSLEMLSDRNVFRHLGGDLSQYMTVTLSLGDLYDRWMQGGGHGRYAAIDPVAKTVTYDAWSPLRLDSVLLTPDDMFPVKVTFSLKDSVVITCPVRNRRIFFRQLAIDDSSGKQAVEGAIAFAVSIDTTMGSSYARKANTSLSSNVAGNYTIFPNPATTQVSIAYKGPELAMAHVVLTDIIGRVMLSKDNLPMQPGGAYQLPLESLAPGVYFLKVTDNKKQIATFKVLKR